MHCKRRTARRLELGALALGSIGALHVTGSLFQVASADFSAPGGQRMLVRALGEATGNLFVSVVALLAISLLALTMFLRQQATTGCSCHGGGSAVAESASNSPTLATTSLLGLSLGSLLLVLTLLGGLTSILEVLTSKAANEGLAIAGYVVSQIGLLICSVLGLSVVWSLVSGGSSGSSLRDEDVAKVTTGETPAIKPRYDDGEVSGKPETSSSDD